MPKKPIKKVEAHAHLLTQGMLGSCGDYGPEAVSDAASNSMYLRSGKWATAPGTLVAKDLGDPVQWANERIEKMDAQGIDVMGVTISPLFYMYGADAKDALRYVRICNEQMEEYCDVYPGRFYYLPPLPLQDMKASVEELKRLQSSKWARGVNLATDNVAGRDFNDDYFDPLFEVCASNDIPLFLHPAPIGTDDPDWDPAKNKKDPYAFGWIAGYIFRESLAYGNLIFGGALDRFPNLKICLTHGGGFVPYQLGRFAEAARRQPANKAKKPIEEYNKNFYFENSVHDPRARDYLMEIWGVDNIYTGSNFDGWDQNDGFGFAETMAKNPEDLHKLWAGNSIKLFNLGAQFGRDA